MQDRRSRRNERSVDLEARPFSILGFEDFVDSLDFLRTGERNRLKLAGGGSWTTSSSMPLLRIPAGFGYAPRAAAIRYCWVSISARPSSRPSRPDSREVPRPTGRQVPAAPAARPSRCTTRPTAAGAASASSCAATSLAGSSSDPASSRTGSSSSSSPSLELEQASRYSVF